MISAEVVRCKLARLSRSCVPPPSSGDGRDRRALHVVERRHSVLWGLHSHVIVHAVFRIEPLVGRHLAAGGKRNQEAAGNVSLSESGPVGFNPVDVYPYGGIVHCCRTKVSTAPGSRAIPSRNCVAMR